MPRRRGWLACSLTLVLTLCSVPMAPLIVRAQQSGLPKPDLHELPVVSEVLGRTRTAWIWTPPGYATSGISYPVIYLLDPEVHFRHLTALSEFLAYYLRMPDVIVVGIPHLNRTEDLVPAEAGPTPFARFLSTELRPAVARRFRTEPFAVLVGHSLGGLLTLHTAVHTPAAFEAYVAISPSLYWRDSAVVTAAAAVDTRRSLPPVFLALSQGEPPNIVSSTRAFADVLMSRGAAAPRWTLQEFAGENHLTVPYVAVNAALRWTFEGFAPPLDSVVDRIATSASLAVLDEHYAKASARFGYDVGPSDQVIRLIGNRLLGRSAFVPATALFGRRVARAPDSIEAHDDLARAYDEAGDKARALVHARLAARLARDQEQRLPPASLERLRRLEAGTQ